MFTCSNYFLNFEIGVKHAKDLEDHYIESYLVFSREEERLKVESRRLYVVGENNLKIHDTAISAKLLQMQDDDIKGKDSLKRLLSQRKTTRSRSFFIEEKSNDQIEEVDSFKTIRKRVLEELTLL